MRERATAGARLAQKRARLQLRRAAEAQDGFTLPEMLVVLAILGIVLVGITQLFTSGMKSQTDQTNRTQAQQEARLGLDKLRREIRCASDLTTPSGYPASQITITLGIYCPTAGGATKVTWCTKPAASGGQPYTLWRYTGPDDCSTPTPITLPTKWASNLVDKADAPSISAGRIFGAASVPAPTLASATTGGTLAAGIYSYEVTPVLAGGVEVPGTVAPKTITSGPPNQITVSWSPYALAMSYNLYGWDGSVLRLLKNVTSGTSFVDTGPTKLTSTLTLTGAAVDIPVDSTSNFNEGATATNTIAFGPSGPVTCTGTASSPTRFTGCTGGQAGPYPQNTPVDGASSTRPPHAALSVSLVHDMTPASSSQRFVLLDTIVLRNSQPF